MSPKAAEDCPLLLYLEGRGRPLQSNGPIIQKTVEAGFICAYINLAGLNSRITGNELNRIASVLKARQGLEGRGIVWMSNGADANWLCQLASESTALCPNLLVCIPQGQEMEGGGKSFQPEAIQAIGCPIIIAGQNEDAGALANAKALAKKLRESGNRAEMLAFKSADTTRNSDALFIRELAENARVKSFSPGGKASNPVKRQPTGSPWKYFWPAAVLLMPLLGFMLWEKLRNSENTLLARKVAVCSIFGCGIVAGATSGFATRTGFISGWQRDSKLKGIEARFEKEWNVTRTNKRQIGNYIDLADYNRGLVNWELNQKDYEQYVLNPGLSPGSDSKLGWRQEFWKFFFPKIRKAGSTGDAALVLVQRLREEVEIDIASLDGQDVEEIWNTRVASPAGFRVLYMAALRSIGVGARMNPQGFVEILSNEEWMPAPLPSALVPEEL